MARNKTAVYWKTVVHTRQSRSTTSHEWGTVKPQRVHPVLSEDVLHSQLHYETNPTNYKLCLLKVNKTFEDLQILQELNEAWMEVGPQIKNYMESSVEIQLLQVRLTSHYLATRRDECAMIHLDPKILFFHILFVCVWQDLLKRPEVAVLVNLRLENTSWTASRIARFLSTPSPDAPRKSGAPSTWLDVYNDLSHTITTLAQVTEVRSLCPSWFLFMLLSKHVRFFSLLLRIRTEHIMFDEIGDGNKNCTQFSRNRGKWFCLLQCQMLNCTYSF